jgi:predicted RNA-binding Zn ribbon-like protein
VTFAHDARRALITAAALVNSTDPDTITTVEELDTFCNDHGYSGSGARTRQDLDEVRAVRGTLRALITGDRDSAAVEVNQLLVDAGAVPQLVRHDEWDWHLHAVGHDRPLATRIMVEVAMALIDVIRADEFSRLSVCAGENCPGVAVDLTRNRSRRFCSAACGNRVAVAAYRARNRTA